MYPVTQAFEDAIRARKRQVLARVAIDYTDPLLDQSITVTASEQARISWPAQTADTLTQPAYLWASLDGTWTLGQFRRLMPDTEELAEQYQVGWWGQQLAGAGGAFTEPCPRLIVEHSARPIHALKVTGDALRGEYPVDFTIRLRDAGGAILHEEQVLGNGGVAWTLALDDPVLEVTSQELEIYRWSHEGRQVKILEFYGSVQQVYEELLTSVRLLEERETSQGSLPIGNISANELEIALNNADRRWDPDNDESPLYGLVKPNRRIRAWLGAEAAGAVEWVPLGTFWSLDWDLQDDTLEARVRARDRLELLRQSSYQPGGVAQDVSLYALTESVLQDGGLKQGDYEIDTALQSVTIPWAWLAPMTHREALRIIAEAAAAVCYCGRDGKIHIALPANPTPTVSAQAFYVQGASYAAEVEGVWWYTIGPDDYFLPLRAPSRRDGVANEIVVTTQPLRASAADEEVYRSSTPIVVPASGIVTVTARYNQPPVIDAVASLASPSPGVTITEAAYYAWGAEVTVANSNDETAEALVVVTGKPLAVQGGEQVIARDQESIRDNGILRYELPANPLVQTLEQARAIAAAILDMTKTAKRDIELEWRGDPALELGDPVSVITDAAKGRRSQYVVVRQELRWTGALDARLSGRRIE